MAKLRDANIQIVGISYDEVAILKKATKELNVTYPLLSDPDSATIDAYGIRNKEVAGKRIDGVPHPITFILDHQGKVRSKLRYEGYRKRHTGSQIIEEVNKLQTGKKAPKSEKAPKSPE